jgi:tight adherence protein B
VKLWKVVNQHLIATEFRGFCLAVAILLATLWLVIVSPAWAAGVQVVPASSEFPQRAVVASGVGLGGLSPARLHVLENGEPVRSVSVRSLRQPSEHDFGVVLVIDVSPNVTAIKHAVAAARALAADRPSQGMLGIVEADAFPPIALPLTRDSSAITNELATTPVISRHGEHVYDAVLTAVGMLRTVGVASGSVIVLSDGADRGDAATLKQVLASAGGGHIRIFSVGIASPRFNTRTLTDISTPTGGTFIEAGSSDLSQVFAAIESRLSSAYLIRYRSTQSTGDHVAASLTIKGVPGVYDISYFAPSAGAAVRPHTATDHPSFWRSAGLALLVSFLCAILIGVAVWALFRRREGVLKRVGSFVSATAPGATPAAQRTLVQRALGDPRRRKPRSQWFDALILELDVARIRMSPGRLGVLTLIGTFLLGWLLVSATSSPVALILALSVPLLFRLTIRSLANRQRRRFEEQLPDNLQVLASAMRAGHTFLGAIGIMVEDAPEPSRRELRQALTDEHLGVPLTAALDRVADRMKSSDFQQVRLVAMLQSDTGGNTAEVVDLVTDTIRDRLDLRRFIRTLTAQGRLAGGILTALPIALLIAIAVINPSYAHPLFHKVIGIIALIVAALMVMSGGLILRRIIDIEV